MIREAIGGLVRVTNQAQSLLAVQTMLPYAIIDDLTVALIVLGIVGIYPLSYQMAAAQAQRSFPGTLADLPEGRAATVFLLT